MPPRPHEIHHTRSEWTRELQRLPLLQETGGKIPSFFLAHGQPLLIYPPHLPISSSGLSHLEEIQGPTGPLAAFLQDLGPVLLDKYQPKAIVVFSAHWETEKVTEVTDYGDENPLLYDYYGFHPDLFEVKFLSKGDTELSKRVVELLRGAGLPARTTTIEEARGADGRGFNGPGLDHGVFIPFLHMFGTSCPIPIVQVSISSSLLPTINHSLGLALSPLRSEGILILAGGQTIHTFQDKLARSPKTAEEKYKDWEREVLNAVEVEEREERNLALFDLVNHPAIRSAHPREEHFVPIYIAAGAASDDEKGKKARVVMGAHGVKTIVFGV